MWQIVIIMFMPLMHDSDDAIAVTHLKGEELVFQDEESCLKHVWDNVDNLIAFGRASFPDRPPVKSIGCHEINDKNNEV